MRDTRVRAAGGKVLWHFTMSLDGFVAGPDRAMDWMTGLTNRPGLIDEYVKTTGAVTHDPEDATPADDVTFLTGGDLVQLEKPEQRHPTER